MKRPVLPAIMALLVGAATFSFAVFVAVTSVRVGRRLRALLEELLATVRPEHRAVLEEELRRLDATWAEAWDDSVDLDRARDDQGIGGPQRASIPIARGSNAGTRQS